MTSKQKETNHGDLLLHVASKEIEKIRKTHEPYRCEMIKNPKDKNEKIYVIFFKKGESNLI